MNGNNENLKISEKIKKEEKNTGGTNMTTKNNNQEEVNKQDKKKSESKYKTIEVDRLGIRGITRIPKVATETPNKSIDRRETKSFKIDEFIYQNYQSNEEFVISAMSEYLRSIGFATKDISGQMHSKKVSGLLSNRKPTPEEAKVIGKGVSIWKASPQFYEKLEAELEFYKKLDDEAKTVNKPDLK
ncbi:hypothetical protein [uncultured Vagococcus sp.]|uniref:hypothetical protein n=1 Tax=uncultured Vagococcus sp. TaxID=189676 RepID=UPI00258461C9|nr:hypothetical protein [uncultured Vagococcus sp.]